MVKKAYEVANKMYYSVGVGGERRVRVTTASQVRCNHMITMTGQKGDLVAPWIPKFWKAVKKKHQWSSPLLCYVHPYSIGFDPLVIHLTHGLPLLSDLTKRDRVVLTSSIISMASSYPDF
jgi:hypothetical protein